MTDTFVPVDLDKVLDEFEEQGSIQVLLFVKMRLFL